WAGHFILAVDVSGGAGEAQPGNSDGEDADDDEGQARPVGKTFAMGSELALCQLRCRQFHRTLAIEENARFEGMSRRNENAIDMQSLAQTSATRRGSVGRHRLNFEIRYCFAERLERDWG